MFKTKFNNMELEEVSEGDLLKKNIIFTEEEFLILKQRYDEDYKKYWTHGNNSSKYSIISMDEFKKRLVNSTPDFFNKYGKI